MAWEHETTGWVKIAEGETKEFLVKKITERKPTANIKAIPNKQTYYEFETNLGTLTVNNLGLFSALLNAKVREKDRIRVTYIKKGTIGNPSKFEGEIIAKGEEITPF